MQTTEQQESRSMKIRSEGKDMSMRHPMLRIARATSAMSAPIANAQAPGSSPAVSKYAPDVPARITTPDAVQTRIGTLRFKDGAPDPATVALAYDQLDFGRGVDAF